MKFLKKWYKTNTDRVKFYLINKWTKDRGLTIVRIVTIGDVDYIAVNDGSLRKIGKK